MNDIKKKIPTYKKKLLPILHLLPRVYNFIIYINCIVIYELIFSRFVNFDKWKQFVIVSILYIVLFTLFAIEISYIVRDTTKMLCYCEDTLEPQKHLRKKQWVDKNKQKVISIFDTAHAGMSNGVKCNNSHIIT